MNKIIFSILLTPVKQMNIGVIIIKFIIIIVLKYLNLKGDQLEKTFYITFLKFS